MVKKIIDVLWILHRATSSYSTMVGAVSCTVPDITIRQGLEKRFSVVLAVRSGPKTVKDYPSLLELCNASYPESQNTGKRTRFTIDRRNNFQWFRIEPHVQLMLRAWQGISIALPNKYCVEDYKTYEQDTFTKSNWTHIILLQLLDACFV